MIPVDGRAPENFFFWEAKTMRTANHFPSFYRAYLISSKAWSVFLNWMDTGWKQYFLDDIIYEFKIN
jgi:hypothetical protein